MGLIFKNEIILCEIYELFYWQEPKFDDEATTIKIHSMLRILSHYGVSLPTENGFSINSVVEHFPYNDEIQEMIDILKNFRSQKEVPLNEDVIMKIQIISMSLHNKALENNCNFDSLVCSIAKVLHVHEQVLPSKTGEDISALEYIDCNKDEVNDILSLIKSLDTKIEDINMKVK